MKETKRQREREREKSREGQGVAVGLLLVDGEEKEDSNINNQTPRHIDKKGARGGGIFRQKNYIRENKEFFLKMKKVTKRGRIWIQLGKISIYMI